MNPNLWESFYFFNRFCLLTVFFHGKENKFMLLDFASSDDINSGQKFTAKASSTYM